MEQRYSVAICTFGEEGRETVRTWERTVETKKEALKLSGTMIDGIQVRDDVWLEIRPVLGRTAEEEGEE